MVDVMVDEAPSESARTFSSIIQRRTCSLGSPNPVKAACDGFRYYLGTNTEKMPRYFSSLLSADAMYSMAPPLSKLYPLTADVHGVSGSCRTTNPNNTYSPLR